MCSAPKAPKDKPPVYLVNPLLNGLRIGEGMGRDSLRTDLPTRKPKAPTTRGLGGVVVPDLAIPGVS